MQPKTADVVVIVNNSVLLVRRKHEPYQGFFVLPGGHIDGQEPSLAAAMRELHEETGFMYHGVDGFFKTIPSAAYAHIENRNQPPTKVTQGNVTAVYACKPFGDESVPEQRYTLYNETDETAQIGFTTIQKIMDGEISIGFDHFDIIKTALEIMDGKNQ